MLWVLVLRDSQGARALSVLGEADDEEDGDADASENESVVAPKFRHLYPVRFDTPKAPVVRKDGVDGILDKYNLSNSDCG